MKPKPWNGTKKQQKQEIARLQKGCKNWEGITLNQLHPGLYYEARYYLHLRA